MTYINWTHLTRNVAFKSGTSVQLAVKTTTGLSKWCFVIPVGFKLEYFLTAYSYSSLMSTRFNRQLDENIRSLSEHMLLRTGPVSISVWQYYVKCPIYCLRRLFIINLSLIVSFSGTKPLRTRTRRRPVSRLTPSARQPCFGKLFKPVDGDKIFVEGTVDVGVEVG